MNKKIDYLQMYAKHFNLTIDKTRCFDKDNKLVLFQSESKKHVNYKNEKGSWHLIKKSDLILNILNDIPLHK